MRYTYNNVIEEFIDNKTGETFFITNEYGLRGLCYEYPFLIYEGKQDIYCDKEDTYFSLNSNSDDIEYFVEFMNDYYNDFDKDEFAVEVESELEDALNEVCNKYNIEIKGFVDWDFIE